MTELENFASKSTGIIVTAKMDLNMRKFGQIEENYRGLFNEKELQQRCNYFSFGFRLYVWDRKDGSLKIVENLVHS